MLRTILVLMIATALSFSLFGCGGEKPATQDQPAEEAVETPTEETVEEIAPAEEGEEVMEEVEGSAEEVESTEN
jgi:hypothetical protein